MLVCFCACFSAGNVVYKKDCIRCCLQSCIASVLCMRTSSLSRLSWDIVADSSVPNATCRSVYIQGTPTRRMMTLSPEFRRKFWFSCACSDTSTLLPVWYGVMHELLIFQVLCGQHHLGMFLSESFVSQHYTDCVCDSLV